MSAKKDRRAAERLHYNDSLPRNGRFSFGYNKGHRDIQQTEVYDVSSQSISFRVAEAAAPKIDELIAVEFYLPSHGQIAWYARVVRVELEFIETFRTEQTRVLRIAAVFVNLPEHHQKQLEQVIQEILRKTHANDEARASLLSDAFTVRRRFEVTAWYHVRTAIILAVSAYIAFQFVMYMQSIGGRNLRGEGPPIWPHRDRAPYED